MKNENIGTILLVLALICSVSLACGRFSAGNTEVNSVKPNNSTASSNAFSASNSTGSKTKDNPGLERPDFTVTAEELDKEFTREGVTDKDLAKYENKNIAVSGRVSMLVLEKTGTVQPWVTLYAPGTLHGVSCYFDDKSSSQLKLLKEDQMAKVQGFQNDFIVPKVSPRLEHCVVLEAK